MRGTPWAVHLARFLASVAVGVGLSLFAIAAGAY
jgi:hypothetical protein